MKQGRTLEEVLKEIDRITQQKEDYVVDTRAMRFEDDQLIIPDVRDKGLTIFQANPEPGTQPNIDIE